MVQDILLNYESDISLPINTNLLQSGINITSFGLDENNELLFCGNGNIYKLTSDLGDLNQDYLTNVLDVVQLVNIVLGSVDPDISQMWSGDINSDGAFDVLDVVLLVNLVLAR